MGAARQSPLPAGFHSSFSTLVPAACVNCTRRASRQAGAVGKACGNACPGASQCNPRASRTKQPATQSPRHMCQRERDTHTYACARTTMAAQSSGVHTHHEADWLVSSCQHKLGCLGGRRLACATCRTTPAKQGSTAQSGVAPLSTIRRHRCSAAAPHLEKPPLLTAPAPALPASQPARTLPGRRLHHPSATHACPALA